MPAIDLPPPIPPGDDKRLEDFRKLLQDIETKGWTRFDDLVFKIAAGGLALSLTFLGLLRDAGPVGLPWIFSAWLLWALTLLALLVSIVTGQYGLRSQIAHVDARTYYTTKSPEGIGIVTPWLNHAAVGLCGLALVCFVIFAGVNVSGGRQMTRTGETGDVLGKGIVAPQAPIQSTQTSGTDQRGQVAPQAPPQIQPSGTPITLPGGAGQVAPQGPVPATPTPSPGPPANQP